MVLLITNTRSQYHCLFLFIDLASTSGSQRTVFHRALDCCTLDWNIAHLQAILSRDMWYNDHKQSDNRDFNAEGLPLWNGKQLAAQSDHYSALMKS